MDAPPRRSRRQPGPGACRRSPDDADVGVSAPATACRSPPAKPSRSARRSASSPPSRSASPAPSSPCGPSTPVASPAARHRRWSAPRRRAVRGPHARGQGHAWPAQRRRPHRRGRGQGPGRSPSSPTTAPRSAYTVPVPGPPRAWSTARRSRPAIRSSTGPAIPKELLEIKGVRETQQYLVERGPEGLPGPGRVDPRQAHRADRAPDDPPDRRAGAGRLRLPARRAGRRQGLPRHQQARSSRRAAVPPRAVPS